jgi:hypothetical protein
MTVYYFDYKTHAENTYTYIYARIDTYANIKLKWKTLAKEYNGTTKKISDFFFNNDMG